ncbi:siroheme decarboxylase subunit beta [Flexibacterium corallicola]|uniref:siroheme decarboxylase subunit beta n=1 Tax=Flexibacterium corallicola TaxID=3037259 RepID=UPI00286F578C|nr:AsnC family transcriptional regulator [Pseudovibrio sp. M1P-2-3]
MEKRLDPLDLRLLDEWQRDFPLCARPFLVVAQELGCSEEEVVDRLEKLRSSGRISRVGGTCTPNSISASTLAAVAAPQERLAETAEIIGRFEGVNHSYQRENFWNLWFVATGPDRKHVEQTLAQIGMETGLRVLDLPLVRPFNVDLGFSLKKTKAHRVARKAVQMDVLQEGDRDILQVLTGGMPICETPYQKVASQLGRSETDILARIKALLSAGIISRLGVIVRHRPLGWSSNAMVVWDVDAGNVEAAGKALAGTSGVTLCYERRPVPGVWPYRLYCMIHARSRSEAGEILNRARELPQLNGVSHEVLFSCHCYKQTGALISVGREVAA